MLSRRNFLWSSGASLALSGFPVHGWTKELPRGRVAVIVLEGGMDGLAAVPPLGDTDLHQMRGELITSAPIALNPFFGLHPSLGGFGRMLHNGEAAIVHATAFPYTKRSHFEGQNVVQSGNMVPFASKSGWLGRALEFAGLPGRALSMDMPLISRGEADVDNYYPASIRGSTKPSASLTNLLSAYHSEQISKVFDKVAAKNALKEGPVARDSVSLAKYAGAKMALDEGPAAAVITLGEFDTHADQRADNGRHHRQLSKVDDILLGFKTGLKDRWKDTVILTLTEFGRTVKVNGSTGTDHGYGSAGLLAGGLLKGGAVISQWPGLRKKDLFEGRDLQSSIDYRSVCAACLEKAYGLDHDLIANNIFQSPRLPRFYNHLFV